MNNRQQSGNAGMTDPVTVLMTSTRTAQLISFALIQGIVFFGGIVLFLKQARIDGEPGLLTWLSVGVAGCLWIVHLVVPGIVANSVLNKIDVEPFRKQTEQEQAVQVFPAFQVKHVVACALLEGGAMFCLVAYLLEQNWMTLAVCGALLASLAARFPTSQGVQDWIDGQARILQLR